MFLPSFSVNAGGGFRTHDLQIMSIAFFGETGTLDQAELPRHGTHKFLVQLNDSESNIALKLHSIQS